MAKFVVLDHSLKCVGGHHYEHAMQILRAAEELGCQPVLATNRQFAQRKLLPPHWPVLPLFAYESRDCVADYPLNTEGLPLSCEESAEAPAVARPTGWRRWRAVGQAWRSRRLQRQTEQFGVACEELVRTARLGRGDHIFLPTASLFDLLGVVRYLQAVPRGREIIWHALFHYGFLSGREPAYARQHVLERRVHRQVQYLLDHFPPGALRLYGTTRRLANQFNRLALSECGVLPFPVDGAVLEHGARGAARRVLRLTCAGYLRREKGKALASRFVAELWERELRTGLLQLVVQTNRRQARRMVPRHAAVPVNFCSCLSATPHTPIVWLRHPLLREAYVDLIRESDMAVFLHEGLAYYTRCSGVLVEMLAGGVPVLVPAGSWLAEQVAESIYQHVDELCAAHRMEGPDDGSTLTWHRLGSPGGVSLARGVTCGPTGSATECETDVPNGARAMVIRVAWYPATPPGMFLRVQCQPVGSWEYPRHGGAASVLGPRPQGQSASTLIPLDPSTQRVRVSLSNAYEETPLAVRAVQVDFLGAPAGPQSSYASGRVGLVYADVEQLPRLVREMREHYEHYEQSARAFAVAWRHRHDARRIVERLLYGVAQGQQAVA